MSPPGPMRQRALYTGPIAEPCVVVSQVPEVHVVPETGGPSGVKNAKETAPVVGSMTPVLLRALTGTLRYSLLCAEMGASGIITTLHSKDSTRALRRSSSPQMQHAKFHRTRRG